MREYQQYNQGGKYEPFVINDCGVCLNPVEIGRTEAVRYEYCVIFVAQFPDGKWYTGYHLRYDNHGCEGVASPTMRCGDGANTLQGAVLDIVEKLTKGAGRRNPSEVVWINEMLRRAKEQVTELTLF